MVVFITLQEQHCALDIKAQILDVYITSNKKMWSSYYAYAIFCLHKITFCAEVMIC